MFKEQVQNDIKGIFLNASEFADVLVWNGIEVTALQDTDQLMRNKQADDNIVNANNLIFVAVSDFETAPNVGDAVKFKGRKATIIDIKEDLGMYELTLDESRR